MVFFEFLIIIIFLGAKTGSEVTKKREDTTQLQQNHINGAQSTSGKCK